MKKTNLFKMAALTAVFALGSMFASAQTTVTTDSATVRSHADGPVVKVIDNKGTVKYLQSNNGITTITSTVLGNQTTTTWQLGGTLDTNTYIDVNGKVFGLDNIPVTAVSAATATTLDPSHTGTNGVGWTLLVRNEATGGIEKLVATDLIQSGQELFIATANQTVYNLTTAGNFLPLFKNVYVYRNGAKLIAGVDYTITDGDTFTLINTGTETASFEPYPIYAGDRIEIHYIK
jgi:hypothetical protein